MFACRNCDSTNSVQLYRELPDRFRGLPGRFSYVRCAGCGLFQIEQAPSNLGDFYSGYRLHSGDSLVYALFRSLFIGRCYIRPRPAGTLLDIGCGNGWYLKMMQDRGWRGVGFEFSEEYAKELSAALGMDVLAKEQDLAGRAASFDLVTFNFSFEHLERPRQFIELARRCLRQGGRVYLSVPNIESSEAALFGPMWFHLDPPRHLALFTKAQLSGLLESAGFEDVRVRNLPVPTGFAGSMSNLLTGRFHPLAWYLGTLPGALFSLLVRDGNFGITAVKA